MWGFTSIILIGTLMYGWANDDIAFGRLNEIPLPQQFQWYHALAPVLFAFFLQDLESQYQQHF